MSTEDLNNNEPAKTVDSADPGGYLRILVGLVTLIGLPTFIALLAVATKFGGLTDPKALDHAQVARHLANGDGFVTSVLRPLSLALHPKVGPHPDLYNAPLHPLLLGKVYVHAGVSEKVTAVMGVVLWLLSVWLTFLMAWHWCGAKVASLAALFYGCSSEVLAFALGGLPVPLATLCVLMAIWATLSSQREESDKPSPLELVRIFVAGLTCGLATLTDYRLIILTVVIAAYLLRLQRQRGRTMIVFCLGLLVVLGPWAWRNYQEGVSLISGLSCYDALANTTTFPGTAIWRRMSRPPFPLLWLIEHPQEIFRKSLLGLTQYRMAAASLLDPLLICLFIVAIFGVQTATPLRRRLLGLVLMILVLGVVFACLFQPDPSWLAIWLPFVAIVAAAQLIDLINVSVGDWSFRVWKWLGNRLGPPDPVNQGQLILPSPLVRMLTYTAVGGWSLIQVLLFFYQGLPSSTTSPVHALRQLATQVHTNALVLTDRPTEVAWYAERRALLFWQNERDWEAIEKVAGPVEATCVSPQFAELHEQEWRLWWNWLVSPHGVYRDLSYIDTCEPLFSVRLRSHRALASTTETNTVARLEQEVDENPESSDARTRLALAYYQQNCLREATKQFQEAMRCDPCNITATVGLWRVRAEMSVSPETLRLAQTTKGLSAQNPQNIALLEEAAKRFERLWNQQSADPWLLLNAANCYSRLKNWEGVARCYRQLTTFAPRVLPPEILLADWQLQQGLIDDAEKACEQFLQKNPKLPIVHELQGIICERKGQLLDALAAFEALALLCPTRSTGHQQAGRICLRLGLYEEAERHFQRALNCVPRSIEALLSLAEVYIAQRNDAKAIASYESILQNLPNHFMAMNNLMELYARNRQFDRAKQISAASLRLYPTNPLIRDTAGWLNHLAGNDGEALLHLQEAVRLAPTLGISHYHLGHVLLASNKNEQGLTAIRIALKLGLPDTEKADAIKLTAQPVSGQ